MSNPAIVPPAIQQHCLRVQDLIEAHNAVGLTRHEIGTHLEGPPPSDPRQLADYNARVAAHSHDGFDEVRRICRAFFEAGIEGWGFIWSRQVGLEWFWHIVAKVQQGSRTPIVGYFPAGQMAQRWQKEFVTRTRSVTRIEVAHVKSMQEYARSLPRGAERKALLDEVQKRLDAVEIRNLRLAALNMDGGMKFEDFEQLVNPKDRRLRLFSRQTKAYVESQKRANKELRDLVDMYEAFKQILNKDPRELGEGAAKIDRAKP